MSASDPLSHVVEHTIKTVPAETGPLTPEGHLTILSDHITMIIVAGLLLSLFFPPLFKRRKKGADDELESLVPKGWANGIEAICQYLRKEVAEPVLEGNTDRFIKYIWSVFFFVLTMNLLGLIPIGAVSPLFGIHVGGTATANIWVTATLAITTLVMMVFNGVRLGGAAYFAHFCPGPLWLAPVLVPVEIVGVFAKVFALTVRLFANMVAGHVMLAVLLSLILGAGTSIGAGAGIGVAIPVVLGSVALTMLEIFVALLQAYIFTFLTALFIGQSVNVHHDDHHEEAHA
jgi:F-type H+-transporting ATPase subunit a